ncbi:MAG: riboflavin synthase [Burkholderiales bacterium]
MFTGIVAAVGRIRSLDPAGPAACLAIEAGNLPLDDVAIGDSIAVDGVCLTVTRKQPGIFETDVSAETAACTAGFAAGAAVNLEKALRLSDRLGGHLVSGHVDGTGEVVRFEPIGDDRLLGVRVAPDLVRYVARKGSVTVNGVSLTVNEIADDTFLINLIPHTVAATNLGALAPGRRVNIEVDMVARYIERFLNVSKGV